MTFISQFEPYVCEKHAQDVFYQVRSGWVGTGKKVEEFEQAISDVCKVPFVAATTSGTTALIMAIECLELPKGSTILFPAYTFLAGANAAKFMGYKIQLVDIKEDTLCMDPDKIGITDDVSAIMFVNHNAYVGEDVKKVRKICDNYKIPMIEDSSQGFAVKGAGTIGDVAVFSFSVPKVINSGQGGAIITKREDLFERIKRIRDHGDNWRKTREHKYLGVNFKFNDILAAYGLAQIEDLDRICVRRRMIWDAYEKEILIYRWGLPFTWMVCYKTNNANDVILRLKENKIQAVKYYKSVNKNPVYSCSEKFDVAEKVADNLVYLPSSYNLEEKTIKRICDIINDIEK